MTRRLRCARWAFILAIALSLPGCAALHRHQCRTGEEVVIHDSLYLGVDTPNGIVTPDEFAEFLKSAVTPRFPQGLTVWQASGQWRSKDGAIVREASRILNLVHPDDEFTEAAVIEIIFAYKSRFQQEAVLRVKAYACASLQ